MYYNITIFFTICCRTYRMHHQCYGSEKFFQHYYAIKSGQFANQSKVDEFVINSMGVCNCNNYKLDNNNNYALNNNLA